MAKLRLALGLLLLLGLLGSSFPVCAEPDIVEWSEVKTPTDGKPGRWVLALGSDIQHLSRAIDGTLYTYESTTHHLMKSTDEGCTWAETKYEGGAIADIACSRVDARTIYVTDGFDIWRSDDAGLTWSLRTNLFTFALGTAWPAIGGRITSIDVGYTPAGSYIFVGVSSFGGGTGGVFYCKEWDVGMPWEDLRIDSNRPVGTQWCLAGFRAADVYDIRVDPNNFATTQMIMAVAWSPTIPGIGVATVATHKYTGAQWNATPTGAGDVILDCNIAPGIQPITNPYRAQICFPDNFDAYLASGRMEYFVGIASSTPGEGDVYQVTEGNAFDLGVNADIVSLDLVGEVGNTRLLAGGTAGEIWYRTSGGSWNSSQKAPSGDGPTYAAMAPDFAHSGICYAATSGTESAFSISRDGGITWNQLSLIDTTISGIVGLAPSPSYSQDNTLFMLTSGSGNDSLWRSLDGGKTWERVFTSALANVDTIDRVALPPQYGSDNEIVFIAGTSNGNPAIWKSIDNGQTFAYRNAPLPIDAWVLVDDTTLFIGSHDGNNGLVYRTTNSGLTYSGGTVFGSQSLNSVALSPNYNEDETILVGNQDGWVFWSEDNGESFEPLGQQLPDLISGGSDSNSITVAFDPGYSHNNTVYAASHCQTLGGDSSAIYRFIIGSSDEWEAIDTLADGATGQLIVSTEGILYAANFKADGGMERCLNPTFPLGPTFETVTKGLDDGAKLFGLWLCGNRLWSIDKANAKVMTYTDSLNQPVALTSPPDQAPGVGTIVNDTVRNISLDWETLSGADEYEWQLNYDTDFSSVPSDFEGTTGASSARLPDLEPATTYYWRVRATQPVLSPWSEKWSFTTSLGQAAPAPSLYSPEAGARGVPIDPIFQWSAIAGADGYELLVSTIATFDNPPILKTDSYALPTNAWQCNISLNYNTTYYWKVRAINSNTYSAWSAVSAFTTEPAPSSPTGSVAEMPQSENPDWLEWLMPMGGILLLVFLLVMMAMLIIMIILVIKVSRL